MSHSGRLTVVSRIGPCSPVPAGEGLNTRQILLQDRARVKLLQSLIAARQRRAQPLDSLAESSTPVSYGIELFHTNNYIVKVGFGTPTKGETLVFDTGSDLTWIRCEPCSSEDCSRQMDSVFDPVKSSSFLDISCNSADCSEFKLSLQGQNPGCTSSVCDYQVDYKDKSMSAGSLGSDTITLTSTISVPKFRFGCSHNTRGKFGTTSGVLGLGPGKVSLVSQSEAQLGKVFSYYLPEQPSSTGFLSFAPDVTADVKFTPLLNLDNPSFYFVNLRQIKVGDGILPVSGSISTAGGTLFDSGTVITRLPPDAYAVLKSTFRQAMANFTLADPEDDLLDTCYDFSGYDRLTAVPSMALVFGGGVQLDIVVSGIMYGTSKSRMCLAFAPNSSPTDYIIIGNKVQRGYEVIYDVGKQRLGFKVIRP
ncbi:aspartyl protease family protein At5g10770-like [Aristolochia californica]|uniref:aspartyl protease family protein At5g10770-like n=1 Tax=Aristolochia californica TaxID=171875 RepID=UPI0035DC0D04